MQNCFSNNILAGLEIGYENLKSQVQITNAYLPYSSFRSPLPNASGKTTLINQYLTVHPVVGKRISLNKFTLNLTLGPEAGLCLRSTEQGAAITQQGAHYTTYLELNQPPIDVRARVNAQLTCKRTGLLVGYSYGLTNYFETPAGTTSASGIYTRYLRLGISYQIRKT